MGFSSLRDGREIYMVKRTVAVALLAGVMASLASLHAVRSETGVPQDRSAVGYLNLHKRHPDGLEGPDEFNKGYSSDQALARLTQVRSFLDSFSRLTEQARGRLSRAELEAIGNTGAEMQTIGFHNIPLVVEGTILKQEYQLRQLEYKLAQLKRLGGDITSEELERTRAAYAEAAKNFQTFWDTKLPTD